MTNDATNTTETNNEGSVVTLDPQTNKMNLQELARGFEQNKMNYELRSSIKRHLGSGGTDVPDGVQAEFVEYMKHEIKQSPQKYGLPQNPSADQIDNYIAELQRNNKIFVDHMRQTTTWRDAAMESNIDAIIEECEEGLRSPEDKKTLKRELAKRDPKVVAELVKNTQRRETHLNEILKYVPEVQEDLTGYSAVLDKLEKQFQAKYKKGDKEIEKAFQEFQEFGEGKRNEVSARSFQALLDTNFLRDDEIAALFDQFFPTVSYEELAAISLPEGTNYLFEEFEKLSHAIDRNYRSVGKIYDEIGEGENEYTEEVADARKKAFIQHAKELEMSGDNLPVEAKKEILKKFGGTRMREVLDTISDTGHINPDDFQLHYQDSIGITTEDVNSIANLKKQFESWNKAGKGKISNIDNLDQENVVALTIDGPGGKEMQAYYKITNLQEFEKFTTANEHPIPESNRVGISYLGNSLDGIRRDSSPVKLLSYADFFKTVTDANAATFLKDANDSDSDGEGGFQHEMKENDVVVEKNPEYDNIDDAEFQQRLQKLMDKNKVKRDIKCQDGVTFCFTEKGEHMHFTLRNFSNASSSVIVSQGSGIKDANVKYWDFLHWVDEQQKKDNKITYVGDHPVDETNFMEMLADSPNTEDAVKKKFGKYTLTSNGFQGSKDSKGNKPEPCSILKAPGDALDVQIHDISGTEATISLGNYTEADHTPGRNEIKSPPMWKGGKSFKISLHDLMGYIQEHEPEPHAADKVIRKEQEAKEQSGILAGILAIGRLGAIPNVIKKPWEAAKAEWERETELYGNQAARILIDKVPFIGKKNFDWQIQLRANTSRNIKSKIEEMAEEMQGAYSKERQRHIRSWATKYDMPNVKFIAALMGTLASYSTFYYKSNIDKGGLPPMFWYKKVRRLPLSMSDDQLLKDPAFQRHAKKTAGLPEDAPDITKDQLGSVNEIEITQVAFTEVGRLYPQYSNLFRMYEKHKLKGAEKSREHGYKNLETKNTLKDRERWMVEQAVEGRMSEYFSGIEKKYFNEKASADYYMYTINLFWMLNRTSLTSFSTFDVMRDFFKEQGMHIPAIVFNESMADVIAYRKTAVVMAYGVSQAFGDLMKDIFDQTKSTRVGKSQGYAIHEKLHKMWKEYGKEFTDKMSMIKDPSVFMMTLDEEKSGKKGDVQANMVRNKETRETLRKEGFFDATHKYVHHLREKLMEEGAATYRGHHAYDRDFFRWSDEAGFAPWVVNETYIYFDKNFDNRDYWEGKAPAKGDGIWNEFLRTLRGCPKVVQKMVDKTYPDASEGERRKITNRWLFRLYSHMRNGVDGNAGFKGFYDANLSGFARRPEASYWSNDALIYGLLDDSDPVNENTDMLKKFEQWQALSDKYGRTGNLRTPSKEEQKAKADGENVSFSIAASEGESSAEEVQDRTRKLIDFTEASKGVREVPKADGADTSGYTDWEIIYKEKGLSVPEKVKDDKKKRTSNILGDENELDAAA